MTKKQETERDATENLDTLRAWLPPGTMVWCVLRHRSSSGMSRSISFHTVEAGDIRDITYRAARVLGYKMDEKHGGLRVSGCGMDMGFHCVYSLARALYPNGHGCTGERCPSNAHSNGDRDYRPHEETRQAETPAGTWTAFSHWHADGGYALRSTWL